MHKQLFIDGQWRPAHTGATFATLNPATEEVLAEVSAAGPEDVELAVAAARRAQTSWAQTSGHQRAAYLRSIAQGIRERQEELALVEVADNGKPLPEALWDVGDAAGCFDLYAELAEQLDGRQGTPVAVPDPRFQTRIFFEPVGPCALIIPWNYPLLMAAWKVAPALAAGCTCILKPSELTPLSALELAALAHGVGLPAGVLNVLPGWGAEVGGPLASHPGVRKTAFTGSVATGRSVMRAGAQEIKLVSLELGGKSPFLVFNGSSIEAAVEWILFGIFWNQGQVCSATSRLLVEENLAAPLLERLVQEANRIRRGPGLLEGVKLGPLISSNQRAKVHQAVQSALAAGARRLCGGELPEGQGYFYPPTILTEVPLDHSAWREEIFGPVLCVRTFASEEEAIALANDSHYGLAAAVMAEDPALCQRVARRLEAGIVWINCSQPTFSEAPWGGMKQSGIGRELGQWGLDNYLEVKQVTGYLSEEPWGWYLDSASAPQSQL